MSRCLAGVLQCAIHAALTTEQRQVDAMAVHSMFHAGVLAACSSMPAPQTHGLAQSLRPVTPGLPGQPDRLQRRFAAMADGRSTLTASRHANQHACTSISTCMAAPLNTPIKRCRLD